MWARIMAGLSKKAISFAFSVANSFGCFLFVSCLIPQKITLTSSQCLLESVKALADEVEGCHLFHLLLLIILCALKEERFQCLFGAS